MHLYWEILIPKNLTMFRQLEEKAEDVAYDLSARTRKMAYY